MKEKTKDNTEPFMDEAQKKEAAQRAALARAFHMRTKAQEAAKAALASQAANAKAAQERNAARAKNKAMQDKWDATRNDKFGKYNEYLKSLRESGDDINAKSYYANKLARQNFLDGEMSEPSQLKTIEDKMKQFYGFNKGRDASILDITDRMTKVNNILGQAASGQAITG